MGRANRLLAPRVAGDRDRLSRRDGHAGRLAAKHRTDRQSGAPGRDRGGRDALSRPAGGRHAAAARLRRQPGRAGDERHRPGGDRAAAARLRARLHDRRSRRAARTSSGAHGLCRGWASTPRSQPFFTRPAAAHGRRHLVVCALRRLDGRRARRRSAGPSILVPLPRCARPGPGRQCGARSRRSARRP